MATKNSQQVSLETTEVNTLVKECYDKASEEYYKNYDPVYDFLIVEHWTKNIPNKRILELGCGNCFPLGQKFAAQGLEYEGVQISETQVKAAQKNMPEKFSDKIHQEDMLKFCQKASSKSYGGIIAMFSILHTTPSEQVALFLEIHRILSENGLFLLNTVDNNHLMNETFEGHNKRFGYVQNFMGQPSYLCHLPEQWYEKTLELFGFELIMKEKTETTFEGLKQYPVYLTFRKRSIWKKQK